MKKFDYLALFVLEIVIILVVGSFQKSPGYMDAEYYYSGGIRLAEGYGFSEEILWNYLDDPQGLPHPSHGYWMPLASILSAIGMIILNKVSFNAGRIVLILIASFIPVVTTAISFQINKRRDFALLSGILAALPAFYLSYLSTTDTFGITMILGGLFMFGTGTKLSKQSYWRSIGKCFGLGILAGLMHLARVDGIIWIGIFTIFLGISWLEDSKQSNQKYGKDYVLFFFMGVLGYLLIMGPWVARNYAEFGSLLSPGGGKSLWITSYDELYSYPASSLTNSHWVQSGWDNIIKARIWAGWINLQSTIVVEGEIFLAPLIIWGLWKYRKIIQVKIALITWLLIFIIMTLIFPFQGARGGFFHSSGSIQPFLWAVAPVGLNEFILWGQKVRHWNYPQAKVVFQWGMIFLGCFLSIVMVTKRVIGGDLFNPEWNNGAKTAIRFEEIISEITSSKDDIVMINNPPGYYIVSRRPCIVIPNGDIKQVVSAGQRYNAKYLILEENHPTGLDNLYDNPGDWPGIRYIFSDDGTHYFRIDDNY